MVVCFFMRFTNFGFELIFITTFPPSLEEMSTMAYLCLLWLTCSTKRLFNCFYGSHRNFQASGLVLYYVDVLVWSFYVHVHLDPTLSHDTGLEFGLLINDFFLLTPSKLQMDVKILCHFHRWQMKFLSFLSRD